MTPEFWTAIGNVFTILSASAFVFAVTRVVAS